MDVENFREYCLSLPFVTEEIPFDGVTPVYKVAGKMFALLSLDDYDSWVGLKCDPERAIDLREHYPEDILPGYHMNKRHWNSVRLLGNLTDSMIREMTKDSYGLVVAGLPGKAKEMLKG